jgi:hypothetical protein
MTHKKDERPAPSAAEHWQLTTDNWQLFSEQCAIEAHARLL